MTSEPRTEAGRALWTSMTGGDQEGAFGASARHLGREFLAIEDEARSLALSEVEAAVTELQANPRLDLDGEVDHSEMRALDDVLAVIAALREGTKA